MTTNSTDLVAVFEDYETARRATAALIENGFPADDVHVDAQQPPRTFAAGSEAGHGADHPRDENKISAFFHRIFGGDTEDSERSHYSQAVASGNAVVVASVSNTRLEEATSILNRFDPIDLDRSTSTKRADAISESGDRTIPVVQEDLKVGKRAFQSGGVRVYSRVIDTPVEQDVTIREERVRIDRRPVDRPATDVDLKRRDQVIEVIETSEEPVIAKTARVVEEVVVGKEATESTQTVRDSVRHTDVHVENLKNGQAGYEDDFRRDFTSRYSTEPAATYNAYAPSYEWGYRAAEDSRYRGSDWNDVEETIKTDYMRDNPDSGWDRMKGAIRYGFEKVSGKR